ncbi:MAG: hypothetical protein NT034_02900 [Candidatus Magasanikbacteria bacterium]|nr:hypothetical protein [Candidatus Magasanikbacteria bacterium]
MFDKLSNTQKGESSDTIRQRFTFARKIQLMRFSNTNIFTNAEMGNSELKKYCALDSESLNLLRGAVEKLHLSARIYNRILKISRTIADLDKSENISINHLAEALQFRIKN